MGAFPPRGVNGRNGGRHAARLRNLPQWACAAAAKNDYTVPIPGARSWVRQFTKGLRRAAGDIDLLKLPSGNKP